MPVKLISISAGAMVGGGGGAQGSTGLPLIAPANPIVIEGDSLRFYDQNSNVGTWSVSGTDSSGAATSALGTINSASGLYTAPASFVNRQSAGGMQLLPNNHIFNTRIDSLAVNSNSATWITAVNGQALNYLAFFPMNYADPTTPKQSMKFFYTGANNGLFQIPAYPNFKLENGYLDAYTYNQFNNDHHSVVFDTTNGTVQEMYQYYPTGANGSDPTVDSQSGVRYSNTSYPFPSPTVDAAGMLILPLTLRLQELQNAINNAGEVTHPLRFTLNTGYCASSNVWPAQTFASDGGTVPFGAWARLKSAFDISTFSSIAKIILTQMKHYGMILADGGAGWQPSVELTRWPKNIADAFQEIQNAAIAATSFEFIDPSSLMVSSTSGKTVANREIVTFTRTSDSATASVDVILQGIAVTLPHDVLYFMCGTPAIQLVAFCNQGNVTWSMSPTVGTLTSGGLYTPPATGTTPSSTTITATSVYDSSVTATLSLTVFADTTVRLLCGQTANYTDSNSHIWYAGSPNQSASDGANNFGTESAYGYDNGGSFSGTDIQIYKVPMYTLGDNRFDMYVPNGTYTVTGKFTSNGSAGTSQGNVIVEVNGVAGSPLDIYTLAGGNNKPWDVANSGIVITDNKLTFVIRAVGTVGNKLCYISAIQIAKN